MYTVVETPTFAADAAELWSEEDRGAFCAFLAANPQAGDVIPGSGGCRKVRWSRPGMGKRGGVRVIYYAQLENGRIWLLVIYAKAVRGNIPAHLLKAIKETIDHD
ncbi:MAG: transcriptional regulator [Gammaproteobacteria bacterium]